MSRVATPMEEGSFAITVTINDSDGAQTTVTTSATVTDAPLSGSGLNASALAGSSFTAPLANFTDADPGDAASSYSVSISWGDNSSPSSGLVSGGNGSFTAGGTHIYSQAGAYTDTVTITDPGGSSTTTQSQITVSPAGGSGSLVVNPASLSNLTVRKMEKMGTLHGRKWEWH